MAFAVTNWKMYGSEMSEGVSPNCLQYMELDCTALATDTDMDIDDYTPGAFWTDTTGDATYGTVATKALAAMKECVNSAVALKDFVIPEITWVKPRLASAGATAYAMGYTAASKMVNVTTNSGDTPTAFKIIVGWIMKPDYIVKTGSYTTSGWVGTV